MSKVKHPRQKKELSLKHERRNSYGEHSKGSRKAIPRGKRRQHMDERRGVAQILGQLKGEVDDDVASEAELRTKTLIADSRSRGFKKCPDMPLSELIPLKKARRLRDHGAKKRRAALQRQWQGQALKAVRAAPSSGRGPASD